MPPLPRDPRRSHRRHAAHQRQYPVNTWHELIGDAILDRVLHNAFKIELKGESLRKKNAKKAWPQEVLSEKYLSNLTQYYHVPMITQPASLRSDEW